MSEEALVSVIVPMFNGEKYVEQFIGYFLHQNYHNWELIIVDDGSTDRSFDIAENLAKQDERIRLYKRDRSPKGSVTCRNIGQMAARGEYYIHLDIDDIIAPHMVGQRVKYMTEHPDIDYASARGEAVYLHKDGRYTYTGRHYGIDPKKDLLKCCLAFEHSFSIWNNIYRASSFKDYYWNENVKIYTDISYLVAVLVAGYKHAFIEGSDPDYFYVKGYTGAMTSAYLSQDRYESTKYLFKTILDQIAPLPGAKAYKKAFRSFFAHQMERVAMEGSKDQIKDFYSYFLANYSEYSNIRLKLLYSLILSRRKEEGYSSERIRFWICLFLRPKVVFRAGLRRIGWVFNKPKEFVLMQE